MKHLANILGTAKDVLLNHFVEFFKTAIKKKHKKKESKQKAMHTNQDDALSKEVASFDCDKKEQRYLK